MRLPVLVEHSVIPGRSDCIMLTGTVIDSTYKL